MKRSTLLAILFLFLGDAAFGQWSTVSISTRYPEWYDAATQTRFNDVINLKPNDFMDQILANAQIQVNDSGEWLIMGYGDSSLVQTEVGDAIWVVKRDLAGGYHRPPSPALSYPAEPGKRWDFVGGLGFGAGFAKTPVATTSGDRYFALVPLEDFHTSPPRYWITWAMSPDGENWRFAAAGGGTTTDPAQSLKLIRKSDPSYPSRYLHPSMFYNPADGYFYFVFGYMTWDEANQRYGKIAALWWRARFTQTDPYGLKWNTAGYYEVQRLNGTTYTTTNGVLPTSDGGGWVEAAQLPKSTGGDFTGAADPVGLIRLTKQDGTFDSILFLYRPENEFDQTIRYVKGTTQTGTFGFTSAPRQILDMSSLRTNCPWGEPCYNKCTAAGSAFFTGPVQSGWQADGNPRLFAYITSFREDKYPAAPYPDGCKDNLAGLLPVLLNLQ